MITHEQTSVRESAHLVPGDVRLFARFNIVIYVRAENVFTLAELSLLSSSHVGVVAQICVIFRHSQRHGHLHAVCWVPVGREQQHFTHLILGSQWEGILIKCRNGSSFTHTYKKPTDTFYKHSNKWNFIFIPFDTPLAIFIRLHPSSVFLPCLWG